MGAEAALVELAWMAGAVLTLVVGVLIALRRTRRYAGVVALLSVIVGVGGTVATGAGFLPNVFVLFYAGALIVFGVIASGVGIVAAITRRPAA